MVPFLPWFPPDKFRNSTKFNLNSGGCVTSEVPVVLFSSVLLIVTTCMVLIIFPITHCSTTHNA